MTNPLNNIKNEAAKVALSPHEKSAMKARVFGLPAVAGVHAPSPYFFFSYQFVHARVLAPLMVLLIVFVGAGTAAAAQGSLPGDILYPVKLSVNETVQVALATTPIAKAQVQATLAERRVQEAEALSAKGTLTPATSAALAANFEAHSSNAQELAADVSAEDPAAGAELATQIGSSLAAHSAILVSLGNDDVASTTASQDNKDGSDSLAAQVLARAGEEGATPTAATVAVPVEPADMHPVAFSAKVAATSSDEAAPAPAGSKQEAVVATLGVRAAGAFDAAQKNFNDTKQKLDATTTAQVQLRLDSIAGNMNEASTSLAAHQYAQAGAQFKKALQSSIKLSTLLVAQQRLNKNIISPVLEAHLIINSSEDGDPVLLSDGKSASL